VKQHAHPRAARPQPVNPYLRPRAARTSPIIHKEPIRRRARVPFSPAIASTYPLVAVYARIVIRAAVNPLTYGLENRILRCYRPRQSATRLPQTRDIATDDHASMYFIHRKLIIENRIARVYGDPSEGEPGSCLLSRLRYVLR